MNEDSPKLDEKLNPEILDESGQNDKFATKGTFVLSLCYSCAMSITTTGATIGPVSAIYIGASPTFATFTLGALTLATAVMAIISGPIFSKVGRYKGFLIGDLCFFIGAVFCILSLHFKQEWLEFLGFVVIGGGTGMSQFLRFAAVELSSTKFREKAITYVLFGGVAAGVIGPLGSSRAIHMIDGKNNMFIGSFIVVIILAVIKVIALSTVNFDKAATAPATAASQRSRTSSQNGRRSSIGFRMRALSQKEVVNETLSEIMTKPQFFCAVGLSTLAHSIMIMIMAAVTLSMTLTYHYSIIDATDVILVHTVSMFLPGFYTGKLIAKYGVVKMSSLSASLYIIAIVSMLTSHSLFIFYFGMMCVGLGWNLGFSSGSVLLLTSYDPKSKVGPLVQSRHDFTVFLIAGISSLVTGEIYGKVGWDAVLYVTSSMVAVQVYVIYYVYSLRKLMRQKEVEAVVRAFSFSEAARSTAGDLEAPASANRVDDDDHDQDDGVDEEDLHGISNAIAAFNPIINDMRRAVDGGEYVGDEYVSSEDRIIEAEVRNSLSSFAGDDRVSVHSKNGEGFR